MSFSSSLDTVSATPVGVCGTACKGNLVLVNQAHSGVQIQAGEFFRNLFDIKDWLPRWHCGNWTDFHGWFYILSDLLIWASYYAIPVLLIYMLKKRTDIPFPKIVWLFIVFIILCGTTHLMDAAIFWWPAYRLSGLILFVTAIVSAITVYALYRIMPLILSLRTVEELEREIAERKKVEEKLAASEFLLKEAGRIARVGGWESDLLTKQRTWSDTVYEIFEMPYDFDITGADIISYFFDSSRKLLIEGMAKAANDGTGWNYELQMRTDKGNEIWVRSCGEAFYNPEGNIVKLRGVFMDIDKYKQNESDLKISMDLLTQRNQQLQSFTHILSHNLRNHSNNISFLTSLVDAEELNDNNKDLFDKLNRVSKNLAITLNDLSDAIKVKESSVVAVSVSIEEVTGHVLEILGSEIQAANARIETAFGEKYLLFPKIYLESILTNLISNGIKYKNTNEDPVISLKTYKNSDGIKVLECTDNGIGIDLNLYGNKVFGLYETFHNHKEAHGVGLYLVKSQVESQGGKISIESQPHKGTTFRITLR